MAKKKATPNIDPEIVALYDTLIAGFPDIARKGATLPYTSLNGNMFTFLNQDGTLAIRLSAADRETFMRDHGASLMVAHGAVMKEYVAVPAALLRDSALMQQYLAKSYAYAQTLKVKS
jgi:TfoX/Sxy family transcriptional regulator of competence genes